MGKVDNFAGRFLSLSQMKNGAVFSVKDKFILPLLRMDVNSMLT